MLHIVRAIKTTQCGLNILQPPGSLPFHTSPDSVTSSLFYSAASLLCSISPRFTLCVQKCRCSHSIIIPSCWPHADKPHKLNPSSSSDNNVFMEDESFIQHENCLWICPGCTVQALSCLGFGLCHVPLVSPAADMWQPGLTAADKKWEHLRTIRTLVLSSVLCHKLITTHQHRSNNFYSFLFSFHIRHSCGFC